MNYIKRNLLSFIGVPVGALAGFLYWNYIGCLSGTCAITSDPVNSSVYGAVMGGLLFSIFQKDKKVQKTSKENDI